MLLRVVAGLRASGAKSTGKLHGELCANHEMSRDAFEEVLGAGARAGVLQLSDESFLKDGKQIPYRKASLTRAGQSVDETMPVEFTMKDMAPLSGKRKRKKTSAASVGRTRARKPEGAAGAKPAAKAKQPEAEIRLEAALRAWRLAEAQRRGVPAFRILSDRTLRALAALRPATDQELLAVSGIGSGTVAKYGTNICRVVRENGG
jgi:DNA topoisomerase-3